MPVAWLLLRGRPTLLDVSLDASSVPSRVDQPGVLHHLNYSHVIRSQMISAPETGSEGAPRASRWWGCSLWGLCPCPGSHPGEPTPLLEERQRLPAGHSPIILAAGDFLELMALVLDFFKN